MAGKSLTQWAMGQDAPEPAEAAKCLLGDGTWGDAGGAQGPQGPPGPPGSQFIVVPIVSDAAGLTLTNMTLAESFLAGSHRFATRVDLTNYTQARLVVNKQATAGAAAAIVFAKYRTAFDTTVGNWSALGTSAIQVAINNQNTVTATAWVDLAAGARADVFVTLASSGGDGVLDPVLGSASLQFK